MLGEGVCGTVNVLGFGDELDVLATHHVVPSKNPLEGLEILAIESQNLVLVELHFHRDSRIQNRHTRATSINQHLLKVVEHALEDRQFNSLAIMVVVALASSVMARLQYHVNLGTQRIHQVDKQIQDLLP